MNYDILPFSLPYCALCHYSGICIYSAIIPALLGLVSSFHYPFSLPHHFCIIPPLRMCMYMYIYIYMYFVFLPALLYFVSYLHYAFYFVQGLIQDFREGRGIFFGAYIIYQS